MTSAPSTTTVEDDGEQDGGRAVVEEALGVDQRGQPRRHAEATEQGDHAHRVGGGDERAEQQRDAPGEPPSTCTASAVSANATSTPGTASTSTRRQSVRQVPRLEVEGGLEQQHGQEDVEDEVDWRG